MVAKKMLIALAGLAAAIAAAPSAIAQSYPNKAIRFIVPYPPAGAGDMVARLLGQKLGEALKQQVVVDNRSGAGGIIGVQTAVRAAPDGYTIALCTSSTQVIAPILQSDVPYDAIGDFSPITLTVFIPNILVAHPSIGVDTLQELIRMAKARPGQLSYASNGTGTSSHIAGELFNRVAGIQLIHVPYKGAGIGINDLLGGHVQLLFGGISTSLPHVKSGRLKALAVTSLKRSRAAPDVPTMDESGLRGFEVIQWFGVAGPKGLPKTVVNKLNSETRKILESPEFNERMAQQGLDAVGSSPEVFVAFLKAETAKWTKLLKEAGIRADSAG